jgi:hypothetical protein
MVASATFTTGCGGAARGAAVGSGDHTTDARTIELEILTPEGVPIALSDLRGRPVLLYLFATFDGVSQAALEPLGELVRAHPDVYVIGIAIQPDAEILVDAWNHALEPPFVTGYDPRDTVREGTSDLGEIDSVPTFVALDADGREIGRHSGFASHRHLEALIFDGAVND